jgi:hypothetical protein
MYDWIVKNKTKLLILYLLKASLFIPHVAFASGETCAYNGSANATFYLPTVWGGLQSFNRQTGGTQVQQAGIWHLFKVFDINIYTNPTTVYATSTDVLYSYTSTTTPLEFSTIFNNHGAGTYFAIGNAGYYGLCGDVTNGNGYTYFSLDNSGNVTFLELQNASNLCADPTSRILNFNPLDNVTTANPVNFDLQACIDPLDVGVISGIALKLENIDQNVLLLRAFSPSNIVLLNERHIQTAGIYTFSSTTWLGEGNYRLEACINKTTLFGINNIFTPRTCESHQFIVGSSTFIGNISQHMFTDTNDYLNGLNATSSSVLASTCNPVGLNFDIRQCSSFMLVPDGASMRTTINDLRDGLFVRFPMGYVTRFVDIFANTATSGIPAWTASVQIGAGNTTTPEITTITVDPSDMIAGGASLLESVHDPITNKSPRDVFYPMVQLVVALGVLMTIVADLTGSHKHIGKK